MLIPAKRCADAGGMLHGGCCSPGVLCSQCPVPCLQCHLLVLIEVICVREWEIEARMQLWVRAECLPCGPGQAALDNRREAEPTDVQEQQCRRTCVRIQSVGIVGGRNAQMGHNQGSLNVAG